MSKKILYSILLGVFALPVLVLAQNSGSGSGDGGVTIKSMIHAAENTALFIASGVTVILWIVTGLLFLTAQGAPEKLKSARTALIAAVGGTVLVIVAGSAIALVSSAFGLGGQ